MDKNLDGKFERTIREQVFFRGSCLHSGRKATLTLSPAPAGSGVIFLRRDGGELRELPARVENIVDGARATTLGRGHVQVRTVEHLMAALRGLSVDNVICELDSDEVPMGDGSAAVFVDLIRRAGIISQDCPAKEYILRHPVWVRKGSRYLVALPYDGQCLKVTYCFVGDDPCPGTQQVEFDINEDIFIREVAPARTVAFEQEIALLRSLGLGLGGDLDTVLVAGKDGYLNEPRYPDEVARHKVLDLVGDLALAGRVVAHVIGIGSGHAMNHELARKIIEACCPAL